MKQGIWLRVALITGLAAILAVVLFVGSRYRNRRAAVTGAVLQQNDDTRKQSPIADVEVTAVDGQAVATTKTNTSGFFKLELRPGIRLHETFTLQFRHANYRPFDLKTELGNKLYVVHMVPVRAEDATSSKRPDVVVANVLVRYSIETHAEVNIGSGVKTFQVPNTGDIPCDRHGPCSPDGRWKAAIATASLDAGQGNSYRNARIFCIAGPCPFTKIESDDFSHGGRNISVAVRNWSDTTTFLFEAEVFRQQVSDIVRESYPVIFGRTLNFSLPAAAEGPSLEAELDRTPITFPLPPDPKMSWAACTVIVGSHYSKSYRCELKPGFKFQ
ncbi:MAG TPA: carboxypeptidase-like regulatory domain-containing protein [Candidatus Sulfotelmatobacter sp.]|nr:carboxypeptidase-like regulatory domain-containing protein [Candidatus Sulfotelmatobacter sp.]